MRNRNGADILALLCLILSPILGADDGKGSSAGYVYFGPGGSTRSFGQTLAVGGGGEKALYKGFGVGGELGYFFSHQSFKGGFGMASLNGSYDLTNLTRSEKWAPFVTGGYSLGFRSGVAHFVNYGGGLTYWVNNKVGVRFELRNFHHPGSSGLLSFRVGMSFR
jgi:hypothetical protein